MKGKKKHKRNRLYSESKEEKAVLKEKSSLEI